MRVVNVIIVGDNYRGGITCRFFLIYIWVVVAAAVIKKFPLHIFGGKFWAGFCGVGGGNFLWWVAKIGGWQFSGWFWVSLVDCLKRYITTFWLLVLALLTIVYLFFLRLTAILSWQEILARGVMAILLWLFFVLVDWLACKVWRTQVALGSGDAFLIAILALWLPPVLSLMMLLLAFWSGALVGLVLLLRKKIFHRGDGKLAFIPFLVLGFFGALTYGDFLINLFWR